MMIALTPRIPICRTAKYFNPHFREGSDGQEYTVKGILMLFQSTLPQGKWPTTIKPDHPPRRFQSTLPQGKWRGQDGYAGSFGKFQSTLPQGKWRNINLCKCSRWGISIHTSAREVTRSLETRTGRTNFNPHFRKGSDLYFEYVIVIMQISIHTSAREVTILQHIMYS